MTRFQKSVALLNCLLVFGGCYLFDGPIHAGDLPYRKELLWSQPTLSSVGKAGYDDSSVYVLSPDGSVSRVGRRDGVLRWTRSGQRSSARNRIDRVGSAVIVASGALSSLDPVSGVLKWQSTNVEGLGDLPFATLDTIIFPSTYRSAAGHAYALSPNQQPLWRTRIFPADSSIGVNDIVRTFPPDVHSGLVAYSYVWFIGNSALAPTKGGVALVDAMTGAVRWTTLITPTYPNEDVFPSDATLGESGVYVSTEGGRIYGYSLVDGSRKWYAKGTPGFNGEPENIHDIRPVTAIANTVIAGSGLEYVRGYRESTGEMSWNHDSKNGGISGIDRFGANAVLVRHYNGGLTLLEASSGKMLWILQPRGANKGFNDVCIVGDTVFASSISGGVQAFRLVKR